MTFNPSEYTYKRTITITNSSSSDYTKPIRIDLTDYSISSVLSDHKDVVLTYNGDVIPFHLERFEGTNVGDPKVLWTQYTIPASSSREFELYYNNPDEDESFQDDTIFLSFDDYEDYTEGQSLLGVGMYSQVGTWDSGSCFRADTLGSSRRGHLYATGSTYSEYIKIDFSNPSLVSWIIQWDQYLSNVSSDSFYIVVRDASDTDIVSMRIYGGNLQYWNGSSYQTLTSLSADTWYTFKLVADNSSNVVLFLNDTNLGNVSYTSSNSLIPDYMKWGNYKNWTGDAYLDYYLVVERETNDSSLSVDVGEETSVITSISLSPPPTYTILSPKYGVIR